jgi:uncharacterized protein YoxC
MDAPQIVTLVIALIGSAATVSGSLWKVFRLISRIEEQLRESEHKQEILTMQVNQTVQRIEHVSERFNRTIANIDNRLRGVEGYLTKTTEFEQRGER